MNTVVSNILTNINSGDLWRIILVIIPSFCSIAAISLGLFLIWRLLNFKFDTKFHKRYAKRAFRGF